MKENWTEFINYQLFGWKECNKRATLMIDCAIVDVEKSNSKRLTFYLKQNQSISTTQLMDCWIHIFFYFALSRFLVRQSLAICSFSFESNEWIGLDLNANYLHSWLSHKWSNLRCNQLRIVHIQFSVYVVYTLHSNQIKQWMI